MIRLFRSAILLIFAAGLLFGQSQESPTSTHKKTAKKAATTKKASKVSAAKKAVPAAQPAPSPQPVQAARPLPLPPTKTGAADTLVKKEAIPGRGLRREAGGLLHIIDTTNLKKAVQEGFHEKTRTIGGSGGADVADAAVDNEGNLILVGRFQATVNFARAWSGVSPDVKTAAGFQPSQVGNPDIFVTKINADGSYGWTKRIGNADDELIACVAVDEYANIYVAGAFYNAINFLEDMALSTTLVKQSAGREDIFLLKLDTQGNLLWAKRMGGNGSDVPYDICVDRNDNVYLTGRCQAGIDFSTEWNPPTQPMTESSIDGFVFKVNSDGSFGWQKRFGGTGSVTGMALAANSEGDIYIAGNFTDTLSFRTTWPQVATPQIASAGNSDIFVLKLQNDGNLLWSRCIGGKGTDYISAIAVNSNDQLYLAGEFTDSVEFSRDFQTTAGDLKISVGRQDIFITKLDGNGGYLWTNCMGGYEDDWANGLSIDAGDNVLLAGDFQSLAQFQSEWGDQAAISAHGASDAIFIKINSDGSFGFAWQIGGIHPDRGIAFLSYGKERYCLVGNYKGEANFAEPFSSTTLDSINNPGDAGDIFITEVSY
jgi:hypothetical protein